MSTLKVNSIEANTGSEIDINSTLGTIPSIVVSGVSTVAAGSAAAPSITPTGDSDTGIFFPSADTIAFGEGGSEAVRIDSSGRLLVGTSTSRSNWANTTGTDPLFQIETSGDTRASITRTSANEFGPQFWFGKTQGSAYQVVSNADQLGEISFMGADGSELVTAASITAAVDGTPGSNDMPGRLMFSTTADGASSPTERLRIDSSGRLLVGTTTFAQSNSYSNGQLLSIAGNPGSGMQLQTYSDDVFAIALDFSKSRSATVGTNTIVQNGDSLGNLIFNGFDGAAYKQAASIAGFVDAAPGTNDMPGRLVFSTTADGASSPTERMRILSNGEFRIGQTSTSTPGLNNTTTGIGFEPQNGAIFLSRADGASLFLNANSNNNIAYFSRSGTNVGTISVTTTATAYNTSSDYRLKENVAPVIDGITRLQQLKPNRFNFIADPDKTVDGFIAHEVQSIVPEAITGEKDAVNEDGSIKPQGIDQSKLVPLLTAALQEAIGEIESLKARVAALESA